jgi:uncharacterized protein (TIGR04141 family)
MTPRKSIYSLACFEVTYNEELYILSDSKWYKIGKDFVSSLNDWTTQNIPNSDIALKSWFSTQSEWDYSELYQEDKDFVVLSKKSFNAKRHGDLFMADLYHKPSGSLVYLKKLSSATPLNGQLEQAVVVTDLLREENAQVWKFLLENINQKWPELDQATIAKKLSVVFVLNSDQELPDALPLFDKVALKKSAKALKKLQVNTSLRSVPVGLKD